MKQTKFKQTFFKFSITILVLLYFFYFIDLRPVKENLVYFDLKLFFFSLLIFLPNTVLFVLKWYLLIIPFSKNKFKNTYKKLSTAIFF